MAYGPAEVGDVFIADGEAPRGAQLSVRRDPGGLKNRYVVANPSPADMRQDADEPGLITAAGMSWLQRTASMMGRLARDAGRDIILDATETARSVRHDVKELRHHPHVLALGALVLAAHLRHPVATWTNPHGAAEQIAARRAAMNANDPKVREARWRGQYVTAVNALYAKSDKYDERVLEPQRQALRDLSQARLRTLAEDDAGHAKFLADSFGNSAILRAGDNVARGYAGQVTALQSMADQLLSAMREGQGDKSLYPEQASALTEQVKSLQSALEADLRSVEEQFGADARTQAEKNIAAARDARVKRIGSELEEGIERIMLLSRYNSNRIHMIAERWANRAMHTYDAALSRKQQARSRWERAVDGVLAGQSAKSPEKAPKA